MANSPWNRAIIVTGGRLGEWAADIIAEDDYRIGADSGALFLAERGIRPHLALGDFDSIDERELALVRAMSDETLGFDPVDKDWTDTELAVREAIDRGYRRILIVGGLGSRFDHSLANVHLLALAASEGCEARLRDEHNEIGLLTGPSSQALEADDSFPVVSLLPLTPEASGITLDGFVYPLNDATLRIGMSLGVSNELAGRSGTIRLGEGRLLVIRSRD
ncbi:thiamine diphosphokinase [Cohnella fermenti]